MLNRYSKTIQSVILTSLMLVLVAGLSACDSEPPQLMKAVKQFESDEIRDNHIKHIRNDHMDMLLHKRDQTLYQGIRTKKHSLNACINCHVPEQHNGKILRHTDPEHFCSTCHSYVAAQLDCFQCHVDHPVKESSTAGTKVENQQQLSQPGDSHKQVKDVDIALNKSSKRKQPKGDAVSE